MVTIWTGGIGRNRCKGQDRGPRGFDRGAGTMAKTRAFGQGKDGKVHGERGAVAADRGGQDEQGAEASGRGIQGRARIRSARTVRSDAALARGHAAREGDGRLLTIS